MRLIFADCLRLCGLDPEKVLVHRIVLDPADAEGIYRSTTDLVRTGHALIYQRLQDGAVFGQEAPVAAFVAQGGDLAMFAGLRRLVARRPGLAPGDIVYDPDIAHLLHNFIARAANPMFYDAFDLDAGETLSGTVLHWPRGPDLRRGNDAALAIKADET